MENTTPTVSTHQAAIILFKECSISSDQLMGTASLDTSSKGSNSFINGLTFISTGNCVNIIDTISGVPLTGIIDQTGNDKSKCYTWYPCEELRQNLQIDVVRALEYIFLLCCLHTDPAKDIWYDIQ